MAARQSRTYAARMRTKSLLVGIILVVIASPLFSHCDTLNGPVVAAARTALEKGDVTPVLKWVPAAKEGDIQLAFAKALAARAASAQAKELADQWFFETVVRIHREAEGVSYTGLKDEKPEKGIELADTAIDSGSLDAAQKQILDDVSAGLRKRFAEVQESKKHMNESVAEGRHYVHAYVEFIHYVERLHETANAPAGEHGIHEQVAVK